MKNLYKIEDELYIISDKEKSSYCIKEYPMAGLTIDRCDCPIQGGCSNKVGTVILTTNDLLIKDGVQAIDDTFLEWFIKNPSCERVEVGYGFIRLTETDNKGYWISTPDTEFNMQIEEPNYNMKQEILSEMERLENEEPKQEPTLEEAADLWSIDLNNVHPADSYIAKTGFIAGAKWQQEKMYSEEDMVNFALFLEIHLPMKPRKTHRQLLEQYKKK